MELLHDEHGSGASFAQLRSQGGRRVNRMAGLCSLMDTHHWNTDWQTA